MEELELEMVAERQIANREIKRLIEALESKDRENQQLRDLLENTRQQF